ncbi:MAG: nucleotidyltransferase domain-containing protein [Gemmatimonadetes bacterium]|nr:nucleotidyltransferase domain-containing protein [Gemmatimonadota bacterium]
MGRVAELQWWEVGSEQESTKPRGPERLKTLGQALEGCSGVVFAYLFGGAVGGRIRPLSDLDVAVYLDETVAPMDGRLEAMGVATAHLGTDEVDLVVLNTAPTALVGRILREHLGDFTGFRPAVLGWIWLTHPAASRAAPRAPPGRRLS